MPEQQDRGRRGLTRRDLIKRGAVAGGVIWAAPVIESLVSPAYAFGSCPAGQTLKRLDFKLLGGGPTCQTNALSTSCNLLSSATYSTACSDVTVTGTAPAGCTTACTSLSIALNCAGHLVQVEGECKSGGTTTCVTGTITSPTAATISCGAAGAFQNVSIVYCC
jgi:hypothetical protein